MDVLKMPMVTLEAFSISAGLDYPGIGPEHSQYHDIKRASYVPVTDEEAFGRIPTCLVWKNYPSLGICHAIAFAVKLAKELGPDKLMIVRLSGRGDKDVVQVKDRLEADGKEGKPMPKTLTEKLNAIKAAGKGIFVPISWLETMRKV